MKLKHETNHPLNCSCNCSGFPTCWHDASLLCLHFDFLPLFFCCRRADIRFVIYCRSDTTRRVADVAVPPSSVRQRVCVLSVPGVHLPQMWFRVHRGSNRRLQVRFAAGVFVRFWGLVAAASTTADACCWQQLLSCSGSEPPCHWTSSCASGFSECWSLLYF